MWGKIANVLCGDRQLNFNLWCELFLQLVTLFNNCFVGRFPTIGMATQKKYICAFCARAFTRSEHKQRHERSHTNEKPFHCQHCTSAFVRRDLLQRHCRTVHNVQLLNVQPREYVNFTAAAKGPATESSSDNDNGPPALSPRLKAKGSDSNPPSRRPSVSQQESDFVHLLSISQKLELFLANYDAGYPKLSVTSDAFLTGFAAASHSSFPVLEIIARDICSYLGTINNKPNNLATLNKYAFFKLGTIYGILALGAANANDLALAVNYANRSWDLLISRLIPHYNNNNGHNGHDKTEILCILFLLSYVYVTFDLDSVYYSQTLNCKVVFNYLNDLSHIIMSNMDDDTSESTWHLEWSIYVLLSRFFINSPAPPKIYELFKDKMVTPETLLVSLMDNLSKSIVPLATNFIQEVAILTLMNEYNSFTTSNFLLVFSLRNCLHNCIILLNKSLALHPTEKAETSSVFELFKKRTIINSVPKFHDLLSSYIFCPTQPHHWNLLNVSLKEYNAPFNFGLFLETNMEASPQDFSVNLSSFFSITNESNNNLGIVSFPFLFNVNFIKFKSLKVIDLTNLNSTEIDHLKYLAIEWYVTMVKMLITLWCNSKLLENFIIQCTLYLIDEVADPKDDRSFWAIYRKFTSCYEKWLAYFDPSNKLVNVRIRLRKFLGEYIYSRLSLVEVGGYDANYVLEPSPKQHSASMSSGSSLVSSTSVSKMNYSQPMPGKKDLQLGASGSGSLHLPPIMKMSSVQTANPMMSHIEQR